MTRTITAFMILMATSCAQFDAGKVDRDDDYSNAALSWLGADIQEMLAAWPSPNTHCGSNTVGEVGCTWWRHFGPGDHIGVAHLDFHCEVIARYDGFGVITEIDVRRSRYCYRFFNDRFDRMTRRVSEKKSTVIEK
jgi:hypothetical protein